MYNPETSKHFEPFIDPKTGVKSYVLKTKVAGQQQGFYFVNRAMDEQGRYLWFYCTNPPAVYMTLGVVDFEDDEVRWFPLDEVCEEIRHTRARFCVPSHGLNVLRRFLGACGEEL